MAKMISGLIVLTIFMFSWVGHASAALITTDLQLWFDATDASTIFDANGLNPGEVGFSGEVEQWLDKSPNAFVATAGATGGPIYDAVGMNDQPTLFFGGGSDILGGPGEYFTLNGTVTTSDETIIVVTRMANDGANLGPWVGNTADPCHGCPGAFFNDEDRYFISTDLGINGFIPSLAPTLDTIVVEVRLSGMADIYENGLLVVDDMIAAGMVSINTIGFFPRRDRSFFGEISEILIYDRALTASELAVINAHLTAKYLSTVEVPEPATLTLFAIGLAGLGFVIRRRRRT